MLYEVNDDNWDMCTYDVLAAISNESVREKYLRLYVREFKVLMDSYPECSFEYGLSICDNYHMIEETDESISEYLFPGDSVRYYPIYKEVVAAKEHTCMISGAKIMPGDEYAIFKVFLYNKTKHISCVSPVITLERGSGFSFPSSLQEFELFCYQVEHSYEMGLEEEYNIASSLNQPLVRKLRHS